ncbi:hypothetical protein DFH07DRAFT_82607 [Mycena maculata]|uniref:Histone H1 n=1 Tax=Mycena maculata TaxID=230809 RepID=A0AAD7IA45_9AGAR|nr:hypothetical protein DFH07DRAFT_82347 [Mycena maculata]KAJ7738489.1 hypothetical protein DFH07DRAFT_82607 [Mycena maculata]
MSAPASPAPAPASASTPVAASATKKTSPAKPKKATKAKAAKPAAKKTASKSTSKPVAAHPSWKEIIKECIATSDAPARQGVSRNAIKKFAEDQYKLSSAANVSQLNRAIVSGVEAGIFVQPKGPSGCVKLAPKVRSEASKEVTPSPSPSLSPLPRLPLPSPRHRHPGLLQRRPPLKLRQRRRPPRRR